MALGSLLHSRPPATIADYRQRLTLPPTFIQLRLESGVGVCSPSLDQAAGLFPASFGQRGPSAADRSISSIGALLPIAL
jgi:hypothetical protein